MARATTEKVLGLLADGDVWTGQQLADRLGVGLRTVRRAIEKLRAEGVAVDAEAGPGGGLRLLRGSGLPGLRLDHHEAVGLLLSLAVVESLGLPLLGNGLHSLRAKLGCTFREKDRGNPGSLRRRILIGPPASAQVCESWTRPNSAATQALQSAFVGRDVVRFKYMDTSRRASQRHVEPQYLLLNHPAWYLLGFDRDRHAGRTFRIDRVQHVMETGETFLVRAKTALFDGVEEFFTPL